MKSVTVGRVEITALTDVEGPFFRLSQLFPGVQAEQWEPAEPYLRQAMSTLDGLGVLKLMDGEEPLTDELTAIPTPGHSPGHASLLVSSGGEQALVAGDVVAHPAQVTKSTWNIAFDVDKERAAFTRAQLLDWLEAESIPIAAGHIPGSGFGRIVREEGRRYWRPLGAELGSYGTGPSTRRYSSRGGRP